MGDAAAAARVGRQYSERQGQTNEERRQSDINKLRELNNWVRRARAALFQLVRTHRCAR